MTFRDSARGAVLKAASDLSLLSDQIGILRSVDATESARWLEEIAEHLREACADEASQVASPPGEAGAPARRDVETETESLRAAVARLENALRPFARLNVLGGLPDRPEYRSVVRAREALAATEAKS
jgi:hypothetical protein